ncbi:MAG: M48 family metallopeptidase [Phycisphaerales bacterium]|nr:M48 family metallopeptidase [Phycisphaerales bacterium]
MLSSNTGSFFRRLFFPLLVALMLVQVGCSTNPATGKKIVTLYSWETEKQMGASAAAGLAAQFGGEIDDVIPSQYVREVGMKLVAGIEEGIPDLDWEFTLLNSDVINAFALPGGKVFFTRGLAEKLDSEAEMAGVLGHEIGHVTARHGNQRISKQIGFNALLVGTAVAVGVADPDSDTRRVGQIAVPAMAIGGNLVLLKYGRDDESEADMLGMRYMTRAGYNPFGQLKVMEVLRDESNGASQPEWLSTHPHPESRIEDIREYLLVTYAHTQNNPSYVMDETSYEQRMLLPLRNLPPAPDTSAGVDHPAFSPSLWCAHCSQVASK